MKYSSTISFGVLNPNTLLDISFVLILYLSNDLHYTYKTGHIMYCFIPTKDLSIPLLHFAKYLKYTTLFNPFPRKVIFMIMHVVNASFAIWNENVSIVNPFALWKSLRLCCFEYINRYNSKRPRKLLSDILICC